MNIRQSIGEAVPTAIFKQIAAKIKKIPLLPKLTYKDIKEIIDENKLDENGNLKNIYTRIKTP